MKRHELLGHLYLNRCVILRDRLRHTIYVNPVKDAKVPVPLQPEIDPRLVRKICEQLGIPPK